MSLHSKRTQNLMRVVRRRFGLTQREVAFLLGYESESHVSRLENGSRTPRLPELLVIELVFGMAASTIFPHVRRTVVERVRRRLERLRAKVRRQDVSQPRVSYKTAQLDRVLESLRSLERSGLDGREPWYRPMLASKREPPER